MQLLPAQPLCGIRLDYEYVNRSANRAQSRLKPHCIDRCSNCKNREVNGVLESQMVKINSVVWNSLKFSSRFELFGWFLLLELLNANR